MLSFRYVLFSMFIFRFLTDLTTNIMNQLNFGLSWESFPEHLKEMLQDMWNSPDFTDVTIVCDDQKELRSHKVVLSACSPILREKILSSPNQGFINLSAEGIQHEEMESILEFMYLGQTTLKNDRVNQMLIGAQKLKIKEFTKIAQNIEEILGISAETNTFPTQSQKNDDIKTMDIECILGDSATTKVESNPINTLPIKSQYLDDLKKIKREKATSSKNINQEEKQYPKHLLAKFPCNECTYQTTEKSILNDHKRSKHGIVCNQCYQTFGSQGVLNKHREAKHFMNPSINSKKTKSKTHQNTILTCNYCQSIFFEEGDLKNHIESVHETMKYPCAYCPYQVTSFKMYMRHIKTHHLTLI